MALADTIVNLKNAIVGIFDRTISSHSSDVETELLKLKSRIDALIPSNSGNNN